MNTSSQAPLPHFTEHHVAREGGNLYVRDFAGAGTPYVLLHGFPDNAKIYDNLIPHLVSAGRRVVTLDFLGFGASDKPQHVHYGFEQQLADLEAVVSVLKLGLIIPVAHDAGGPAAVNFALRHPQQTESVVLMNAFYGQAPGLRVPELIELFSRKELSALALHLLKSPQEFAWLLNFQRDILMDGLSDSQESHNRVFLGAIIDDNFRQQPSAAPAFAQMTAQLHEQIAIDTGRIVELRRSDVPFLLIWGDRDPYLHLSAAEYLRVNVRSAKLFSVRAGHWPQIDAADEVASLMLGGQ